MIMVDADALVPERLPAHAAGVALGLQHLGELLQGQAVAP
jgi:hypothetical protein